MIKETDTLALFGAVKCETKDYAVKLDKSTFFNKNVVTGVGAQHYSEESLPCAQCGSPMGNYETTSKEFGRILVTPTLCDPCKEKNFEVHKGEELKGEHEAARVRCAGYQNKVAIHGGVPVYYESLSGDFAFQGEFMQYFGQVIDEVHEVGAYIYGPTGTGKTFLSKILHNELLRKYRHSCFIKAVDLAIVLRKETFGDAYKEVINNFRTVETLIVDDFGTQKDTDFVRETIFAIVDYRYDNQKRTIFTTNLRHEDIDKSDVRLSSRLQDPRFCKSVRLVSKDIRLNQFTP